MAAGGSGGVCVSVERSLHWSARTPSPLEGSGCLVCERLRRKGCLPLDSLSGHRERERERDMRESIKLKQRLNEER